MKNKIFIAACFIIISGCLKDDEQKNPEWLNLSGQVMNHQLNAPIDSASITLTHSTFMSLPFLDTTIYTDAEGRFNLRFAPEPDRSYSFQFDKPGFNASNSSVANDKEFQNFNVALDTF